MLPGMPDDQIDGWRLALNAQTAVTTVATSRIRRPAEIDPQIGTLRQLLSICPIPAGTGTLRPISRRLMVDHLDQNLAVLNEDRIGLDWHHRRRPDHLTGPDVEHPGVEVALDPTALDQTVGQRAGSVRAGIVDDAKFTVEVENGKNQASSFHSESATTSYVICAA